jgi:hypothetical protein
MIRPINGLSMVNQRDGLREKIASWLGQLFKVRFQREVSRIQKLNGRVWVVSPERLIRGDMEISDF